MPAISDFLNHSGKLGGAMLRQICEDFPGMARPIEYFGGRVQPFGEAGAPFDNSAAFDAAAEWSSQGGGAVILGGGQYFRDGTTLLLPYMQFVGQGEKNTIIRQLAVATDPLGSYAPVFSTPPAAEGGSAYTRLKDMQIHGGWESLQRYEGDTSGNWQFDPSEMTWATIEYFGPEEGPGGAGNPTPGPVHPNMRMEYDKDESDTHHKLEGVIITNAPGTGIRSSGRGEHMYRQLKVKRAAVHGAELMTIDITQWDQGSISVIGDTGLIIDGGAYLMSQIKPWFCGMMKSVQPPNGGRGLHVRGQGKKNSQITQLQVQDTYGEAVNIEGRGHQVQGTADHISSGRIGLQGHGYQGERAGPSNRAIVRADCKDCKVDLFISGGEYGQHPDPDGDGPLPRPTDPPMLIEVSGTTCRNNVFRFGGSELDTTLPDGQLFNVKSTVTTNKNHNIIEFNGRLLHGKLTEAELADATHGINTGRQPRKEVHVSPSGVATRNDDGTWLLNGTTTITPV